MRTKVWLPYEVWRKVQAREKFFQEHGYYPPVIAPKRKHKGKHPHIRLVFGYNTCK